jgi:hypothetical protein
MMDRRGLCHKCIHCRKEEIRPGVLQMTGCDIGGTSEDCPLLRYRTVTISGQERMERAVVIAVEASIYFEVTPMPDDHWEIKVKYEDLHALLTEEFHEICRGYYEVSP